MAGEFETGSFEMAMYLIIVFGLMICFFLILRKVRTGTVYKGMPLLKNITTLPLAPKRSIALVEVCEQWILVGIGSDNITLLTKVDKPSDYGKDVKQDTAGFDLLLEKAGHLFNKSGKTGVVND